MKKEINEVCDDCGIEANRLTCLKKYGAEPLKAKFDISTYHTGICDVCGIEKAVTQPRDFFYPDFDLLPTFRSQCCRAEMCQEYYARTKEIAGTFCSSCRKPAQPCEPVREEETECPLCYAQKRGVFVPPHNCNPVSKLAPPHKEEDWRDNGLAEILASAWKQYSELFGEPPYGTVKQFEALCELGVSRYLLSLKTQWEAAAEKRGYQEASEKAGHHFLYEVIPAEREQARAEAVEEERERIIKYFTNRVMQYQLRGAEYVAVISVKELLILLQEKAGGEKREDK